MPRYSATIQSCPILCMQRVISSNQVGVSQLSGSGDGMKSPHPATFLQPVLSANEKSDDQNVYLRQARLRSQCGKENGSEVSLQESIDYLSKALYKTGKSLVVYDGLFTRSSYGQRCEIGTDRRCSEAERAARPKASTVAESAPLHHSDCVATNAPWLAAMYKGGRPSSSSALWIIGSDAAKNLVGLLSHLLEICLEPLFVAFTVDGRLTDPAFLDCIGEPADANLWVQEGCRRTTSILPK